MKKYLWMGAALVMVFAMSSCKSKESAYKKAYEKAKAQQTEAAVVGNQQTTPVSVTPVTTSTTTTTTPTQDYSNVSVRTENVTLVSGAPLKAYSVVVGSFGVKANATGLANTLNGKGYSARVVQANTASNGVMYRVCATSYDSKAEAAQSRNSLIGQYPGAWLLYQK